MSRTQVVRAFSAGGVLYRRVPGAAATADPLAAIEVVLVGRPAEDLWVLPKGTPHAGETPEETALREVREETGVRGEIVGDLSSIRYWFSRKGTRFAKEVRHFLLLATGGDVSLHDHEYDEARWFPLAEALDRLTYANEADVLRRAATVLRARAEHAHHAHDGQ